MEGSHECIWHLRIDLPAAVAVNACSLHGTRKQEIRGLAANRLRRYLDIA
jgi:hypothetical protein